MKRCRVVHYREGYERYGARPGPLGNPYSDGTRAENIARFEAMFKSSSQVGRQLRAWVRRNVKKGDRIACHCSPRRCHLDVVAAYVNNGYRFLRRKS